MFEYARSADDFPAYESNSGKPVPNQGNLHQDPIIFSPILQGEIRVCLTLSPPMLPRHGLPLRGYFLGFRFLAHHNSNSDGVDQPQGPLQEAAQERDRRSSLKRWQPAKKLARNVSSYDHQPRPLGSGEYGAVVMVYQDRVL